VVEVKRLEPEKSDQNSMEEKAALGRQKNHRHAIANAVQLIVFGMIGKIKPVLLHVKGEK